MNPLAQMMGGAAPAIGGIDPQAVQSVRRMMEMLRMAKNPQAAIMQAAQQNPILGNVMQMCNGKNPQTVFMEQCQQHGLDPNLAMRQVQSMLIG